MDQGVPSSVMSPQCNSTSHAGSVMGSIAEWVSDRIKKRTGFSRLIRFEEEDIGEMERTRLDMDMVNGM